MTEAVRKHLYTKPTTPEDIALWAEGFLGFKVQKQCRCVPKDEKEASEWVKEDRQPHQSQLAYLVSAFLNQHSASVFMASRNGGKSLTSAVCDIMEAWFKPGIKIAVVGYKFEHSQYILKYICKYLDHLEAVIGFDVTPPRTAKKIESLQFKNGSEIRFYSGGKSDSDVSGFRPNVLIIDEADKFSAEQYNGISNALEGGGSLHSRFDTLSTNYTMSGDGVVLKQIEKYEQFNSQKPPHMLPKKVFRVCLLDILANCDERYECDTCSLWDYCKGKAKLIDTDGYYRIEEAIGKAIETSRPNFEAEFLLMRPSSEYAIFSAFSKAVHVLDNERTFNPKLDTYLCFDFGGKRCPHAALLIQRVPPIKRDDATTYYVIDEFEGMGLLEGLIAQIKSQYPEASRVAQTYADPAGGRKEQTAGAISYKKAIQNAGFWPTNRPIKRKPSFEMLKALIEPASGEPKLYVNRRCKHLITQIQAAEYETRGGKPTGEPADNGKDDLLDCLRYTIGASWGTFAKHSGSKKLIFF